MRSEDRPVAEDNRIYLCIDLKSFYASVECVERKLDPLTTNLVVADPDRTDKTICLAVSPAMKAQGVKNRCRVFEIPDSIDYIMARPRMQLYIDYSARIYSVYLKYIAREDMHVYSIDEVFLDVTTYLDMYGMNAKQLGIMIMQDILNTTGITATCGIGTNLYLTKIALDITAKHAPDHIGYLDRELYKKTLWDHRPITDFWRIGPGTARRLERLGIYTMRELAHADEKILYREFGVEAELMLDHAEGIEPTTIADIKNYRSKTRSITSGQVLGESVDFDHGLLLMQEMVDLMCLDLVDKGIVTDSVTIHLNQEGKGTEPLHGSIRLEQTTNSYKTMSVYTERLYRKIVPRNVRLKRLNISFNNVISEEFEQYDIFSDIGKIEKERKMSHAVIDIKKKFGKNAIVKGMNLQDGAKTIERNGQIGGHRSGNDV